MLFKRALCAGNAVTSGSSPPPLFDAWLQGWHQDLLSVQLLSACWHVVPTLAHCPYVLFVLFHVVLHMYASRTVFIFRTNQTNKQKTCYCTRSIQLVLLIAVNKKTAENHFCQNQPSILPPCYNSIVSDPLPARTRQSVLVWLSMDVLLFSALSHRKMFNSSKRSTSCEGIWSPRERACTIWKSPPSLSARCACSR